MKKMILLTVALVFVVAGVASAASIVDSAHDMRTYFTNGTIQVCVYCHTPHMPAGRTQDPLWNHSLSTVADYGIYQSSTMNVTPTAFGGSSAVVGALCMSCHDGTVAVNVLWKNPADGSLPGSTRSTLGSNVLNASFQIVNTASGYLGTDMSNDHPVNFTYETSRTNGDLYLNPTTNLTTAGIPLFSGLVQCASCHNVHDPANRPFLRRNNAASALCLVCHIK